MTCYLTGNASALDYGHWCTRGGSIHLSADLFVVSLSTFHPKKMQVHVELSLKRGLATLGSPKHLSNKFRCQWDPSI